MAPVTGTAYTALILVALVGGPVVWTLEARRAARLGGADASTVVAVTLVAAAGFVAALVATPRYLCQ